MARRHRSGRSLRELRDEAAAAEALGLNPSPERAARPRAAGPAEPRPKPAAAPRQRVVWAVYDQGGRVVATFPYAEKAAADAQAAALRAKGKGPHYVRSVKEAIDPSA